MSHKRVVSKRGKSYGPYLYESYRDSDGKVKKRYLGKVVEQKDNRGLFGMLLFVGIVLLLALFLQFDLSGNVVFSGDGVYVNGENLVGNVQVTLQPSEFIPANTLVVINNSGSTASYNLTDLVSEQSNEGLFYIQNSNISGSGLGFGSVEQFPAVNFTLGIYDSSSGTRSISSGGGSSSSDGDSSDSDSSDSEASTSEPVSTPAPVTRGISGNPIANILGYSILELKEEINASVRANETYIYELESGESVEILSSEKSVALVVEGNEARVTTSYLGEDVVLDIDLESLNLTALDGVLEMTLVYEGEEIASFTRDIALPDEEPLNDTLLNETLNDSVQVPLNDTNESVVEEPASNVTRDKLGACDCDSCSSCNTLLQDFTTCPTVTLNQSISGSYCIDGQTQGPFDDFGTFDCQGFSITASAGFAVQFEGSLGGNFITLTNCSINGQSGADGIWINGASSITIEDSNVSGSTAIDVGTSTDTIIRDSRITGTTAIYFDDTSWPFIVERNYIYSSNTGISVGGSGTQYSNILNNSFNGNTYDAYLIGYRDAEVSGNNFSASSYGVYLSDSTGNDVSSNNFNGGNRGVYATASSNSNIFNLNSIDGVFYGFYIQSSVGSKIINSNITNSNYGVYLISGANQSNMSNLILENISSYGVYFDGSELGGVYRSNLINNSWGIYASNSASTNVSLVNITNGTSIGIEFASGSDGSEIGNTRIIGGTGDGIMISSDGNDILNSLINNSGGIVVGGNSNNFIGVTVQNSSGVGIDIDGVNSNSFESVSVIDSNGIGISIANADSTNFSGGSNLIDGSSSYGISLSGATNTNFNNFGSSNNNGNYGIYLLNSDYNNLTGSGSAEASSNSGYDLVLETSISNNITGFTAGAVLLDSSSDSNIIENVGAYIEIVNSGGNNLTGTIGGITLDGATNTILDSAGLSGEINGSVENLTIIDSQISNVDINSTTNGLYMNTSNVTGTLTIRGAYHYIYSNNLSGGALTQDVTSALLDNNDIYGITINASSGVEVTNSYIQNLILDGGSNGNNISSNDIRDSTNGIRITDGDSNNIYSNNITSNTYGILIDTGSSGNLIMNNYFDNNFNNHATGAGLGANYWNTSRDGLPGGNILNGGSTGGNYWGTYDIYPGYEGTDDGLGSPPDHDISADGIGDNGIPYSPASGVNDYLPLTDNTSVNCNCYSCDECELKLNYSGCSVVTLKQNIEIDSATCINDPENLSDKTFSCEGLYSISNNGSAAGTSGIISSATNFTVENCIFNDFENGIYLNSASDNNVFFNTLSSNTNGLKVESSTGTNISDNNADSNDEKGIYLKGSSYNSLYQNGADNNVQGYYFEDADYNNVTLNDAQSNSVGFKLDSPSCGSANENNTFIGNTGGSNYLGAFDLGTGNNCQVPVTNCQNNIDTSNYGEGNPVLYINNTASQTIDGFGSYSEVILCGVSDSTLNDVTIDNGASGSGGIQIIASSNVSVYNASVVNASYGIYGDASDALNISFNNLQKISFRGIGLEYTNNSYVAGNNITLGGGSGSGIFLGNNVNFTSFSGNLIQGYGYGIQSSGSGESQTMADNEIDSNDYGIYVGVADESLILDNNIQNQVILGLYVNTINNTITGNTFSNNSLGINMSSNSENNSVYDNIFNNTLDANDGGTNNVWNASYDCDDTSIIGGCYGGNFWIDYYNQRNSTDRTGDGIGDDNLPVNSSYAGISGSVEDYLPLAIIRCGDELIGNTTIGIFSNLTNCTENGLNIVVDNVSLDCEGVYVGGLGNGIGINVNNSDNVVVEDCGVFNFTQGVRLENSDNVTVTKLEIVFNELGMNVTSGSTGGTFFENYFNNTNDNNAYDAGQNYWNSSILGNFWSDYSNENYSSAADYNASFYGGEVIPSTSVPFNIDFKPYPLDYIYGIFSCGKRIDSRYNNQEIVLFNDLSCSGEDGIIINGYPGATSPFPGSSIETNVSNITINCGQYSITGDGTHSGIIFEGMGEDQDFIFRDSIIKNCIISNFSYGIKLDANAYALSTSQLFGCIYRKGRQIPYNITIMDNEISNCTAGISLISDEDWNGYGGIYNCDGLCYDANVENNTIINNVLDGNFVGLQLFNTGSRNDDQCNGPAGGTTDAYVRNNTITSNIVKGGYTGISSDRSNSDGAYPYGNYIYNNIFNDSVRNAYNPGGENYWNTTYTAGQNIVAGTYFGGNYWGDYAGLDDGNGVDPYNVTPWNISGDYIGDTEIPYNGSGNISVGGDYLPLVYNDAPPTISIELVTPSANADFDQYLFNEFTVNVTCLSGNCGDVNVTLDPYEVGGDILGIGSLVTGNSVEENEILRGVSGTREISDVCTDYNLIADCHMYDFTDASTCEGTGPYNIMDTGGGDHYYCIWEAFAPNSCDAASGPCTISDGCDESWPFGACYGTDPSDFYGDCGSPECELCSECSTVYTLNVSTPGTVFVNSSGQVISEIDYSVDPVFYLATSGIQFVALNATSNEINLTDSEGNTTGVKSFFHFDEFGSASGAFSFARLIVQKISGSPDKVMVCPGATTFDQINNSCPIILSPTNNSYGGYTLTSNATHFFVQGNAATFQTGIYHIDKGIIPTTEGAYPFYTNKSTNPYTINLNPGESELVTFYVNATGDVTDIYEFFAYANVTSNMSIGNETARINITIQIPNEPAIIEDIFVNSSEGTNFSHENLTCWVRATDINADTLNYSGYWYVNGVQNESITANGNYAENILVNVSTLLGGNTTANENWSCNVTAYDGEYFSAYNMSGNLTVLNRTLYEPIATEFNFYSNDVLIDFSDPVWDLSNIVNVSMNNSYAEIRFPIGYSLNVMSEDYDSNIEFGQGFVSVNTSALHSSFNESANVSLYNVDCSNRPGMDIYSTSSFFSTREQIVSAGGECFVQEGKCNGEIVCSGSTATFNVSYFSGYASGTNASLQIWDSNDNAGFFGGGYQKGVGEEMWFYANYTNSTGSVIPSASCYWINSTGSYSMSENSSGNGLYYYSRNYSAEGNFSYNVSCNKTSYDTLNINDTAEIYNPNTCYTCANCVEKLNNSNNVTLLNNISVGSGSCINGVNLSNKIFNCDNNYIFGSDLSSSNQGINISYSPNATIENCYINGFYTGIYVYRSNYTNLFNNKAFNASSSSAGYRIEYSSHGNFTSNDYAGYPSNEYNPSGEGYGFMLYYSTNNTHYNNEMACSADGFYLFDSDENIFASNTVTSYDWTCSIGCTAYENGPGCYSYVDTLCEIECCDLSSVTCPNNGAFSFASSNNNNVSFNTIEAINNGVDDADAIDLGSSSDNNTFFDNSIGGVAGGSYGGTGIVVCSTCDNNTIELNDFDTIYGEGIQVAGDDNLILNNTFNNILDSMAIGCEGISVISGATRNNISFNNASNFVSFGPPYECRAYEIIAGGNFLYFNTADDTETGFYLGSGSNTIVNNSAYANYESSDEGYGFHFDGGTGTIVNNTAISNRHGFYVSAASNITSNYAEANDNGFTLDGSTGSYIYSNSMTWNLNGVKIESGSNNRIEINDLVNNYEIGVYVLSGTGNNITNNQIADNTEQGILIESNTNWVLDNNITGSTLGVNLTGTGNRVWNNYIIGDTYDADDSGSNIWSWRDGGEDYEVTNCDDTSILGGCYGGNFWGSYYDQRNATDLTGDGIGDTPAIWNSSVNDRILGNVNDYLPLAIIRCGDELVANATLDLALNELANCSGVNGLNIIADNVSLDCENVLIDGTGSGYGIYVDNVENARVEDCNIEQFTTGIYVNQSNGTTVYYNRLVNNTLGMNISLGSEDSYTYYNFFNNTGDNNAYDLGTNSVWNSTIGNFWSNYYEDNYTDFPKDDYNLSVYAGGVIPEATISGNIDYEPHPLQHYFESIYGCGTRITSAFNNQYVRLLANLECSAEDGIIFDYGAGSITNVTFDCDGRTISGDGTHIGVSIAGAGDRDRYFKDSLIANCTISNFSTGILLKARAYADSYWGWQGLYSGCMQDLGAQTIYNNIFRNNHVSDSTNGILLMSDEDYDSHPICSSEHEEADVYGNQIEDNTFADNLVGIYLSNEPKPSDYYANVRNNNFTRNMVTGNYKGIVMDEGSNPGYNDEFPKDNYIWDNVFYNTINAEAYTSDANSTQTNYWNRSNVSGTSIVYGPYTGGNYWSDYTGLDNGSDGSRIAGDGLGDTEIPYNNSGNMSDGDYWPLISFNFIPVVNEAFVNATTVDNTSLDDLFCWALADDLDGENLTYEGYWYLNGVQNESFNTSPTNYTQGTLINVAVLLTGNISAYENWSCEVRAYDGLNYSDYFMTENITVQLGNTAPVVQDIFVNSSSGTNYTNENLSCWINATDVDANNLNYTGYWYVNGVQNESIVANGDYSSGDLVNVSTLDSSYTIRGENWTCNVSAYDGIEYSTYNVSDNLTILNSAPYFNPNLENQTIAENSTLIYDINCSDIDLDVLTYYVNDTSKFSINSTTGLINWTPGFDDAGVYWYNVTCGDDENVSQVFNITVTNTNRIPVMQEAFVNSSLGTNYTNETLSCWINATDADGQNLNYTGYWYVNGVQNESISSLNNAEGTLVNVGSLLSGNTTKYDNWSCSVIPFDGEDSGSSLSSDNLTILNAAPQVDAVAIDPDPADEVDDLNCTYTVSDIDQDAGTLNVEFEWYKNDIAQGINNQILNATNTTPEEIWICSINVSDSEGLYDIQNSTGVTIRDSIDPFLTNGLNVSVDFKRYSNFTANISISNFAIDYYKFSTNASGSWVNKTVKVVGEPAEYNATEQANITGATSGDLVCWYYWANDTASNEGVSNTYCFEVNNTAPTFDPDLENQTVAENSTLIYDINCSDLVDSDTITYFINDTSKFSINSTNGLINWTPGFDDSGVYFYEITCGDEENVSQVFNITVTNVNRVPVMQEIFVNASSGTNYTNETLSCWANATDADAESLNYTGYWYVNGVQNESISANGNYASGSLVGLATLGFGNTTKGENWTCNVSVYDGNDYSSYLMSDNLTILNSIPIVDSISINPTSPNSSVDLNCTYTTSDLDNEPLTPTFEWYLNGSAQTINNQILNATNTSDGENWSCSVNVTDGEDYGYNVSSNVTISTAPYCGNGIVEAGESCDLTNFSGATCITQGFTGGTLACTASCTFNTSACTSSSGDGGGCTPTCPSASTVTCGSSLGSDGCGGTCSGTGTLCSVGKSCTAGVCVSTCTPSWTYSSWSICDPDTLTQTRTAIDTNNCGTTTGRLPLSQSCEMPECTPGTIVCEWSSCGEGDSYSEPSDCYDDAGCLSGSEIVEPAKIPCDEVEDEVVVDSDTGESCTVKWQCESWGECSAGYTLEDVINEDVEVGGLQRRNCVDLNKCKDDKVEKKSCTIGIPIEADVVEWCGDNYVEIFERNTGKLVSRVREETATKKDLEVVEISLITSDFTGYCDYCYNGVMDEDETGVDCGGPNCAECIETFDFFDWVPSLVIMLWASVILGSSVITWNSRRVIVSYLKEAAREEMPFYNKGVESMAGRQKPNYYKRTISEKSSLSKKDEKTMKEKLKKGIKKLTGMFSLHPKASRVFSDSRSKMRSKSDSSKHSDSYDARKANELRRKELAKQRKIQEREAIRAEKEAKKAKRRERRAKFFRKLGFNLKANRNISATKSNIGGKSI